MLILCVKDLCLLAKVKIFKIMTARLGSSCKYSLMSSYFNEFVLSEESIKFKLVKESEISKRFYLLM